MINANDLDWSGVDSSKPATEEHTVSGEDGPSTPGNRGILLDCYLCGVDLNQLPPQLVERRKYTSENGWKSVTIRYPYVISYCKACVKRFLT